MRISNIFKVGVSKLDIKSIVAPSGVRVAFLLGFPENQESRLFDISFSSTLFFSAHSVALSLLKGVVAH